MFTIPTLSEKIPPSEANTKGVAILKAAAKSPTLIISTIFTI
jgi:hypothetical protein